MTATDQEADALASAARMVRQGLARRKQGIEDFVEGTLAMAAGLAQARERFPSDQAFGHWCSNNDFDETVISANERAALIAFGGDLARARTILKQTTRRSIRTIYDNEWRSPVSQSGKPADPDPDPPPASAPSSPPGTAPPWPTSKEPIEVSVTVDPAPARPFVQRAEVAEAISSAELDARIKADPEWRDADEVERLRAQLADAHAEITRLRAENERLKAELSKVQTISEALRKAGRKRKGPAP
jgi:hypothetical protein